MKDFACLVKLPYGFKSAYKLFEKTYGPMHPTDVRESGFFEYYGPEGMYRCFLINRLEKELGMVYVPFSAREELMVASAGDMAAPYFPGSLEVEGFPTLQQYMEGDFCFDIEVLTPTRVLVFRRGKL